MAKRFTDTDKWKKDGFGSLTMKMKLVWIYLCDNCDHAGIWDANMRLLEFQIGEQVTKDEITGCFGGKIQWLSSTKLFIPSFIDFQYGELNPDNRAHASVILRLKKEGASMGLNSPMEGRKDKDKDKDKDKEGGVGETNDAPADDTPTGVTADKPSSDLEQIYQAYPKRDGDQGKAKAIKSLRRQLKTQVDFDLCLKAAQKYREYCELKGWIGTGFVKQFKTWCGSLEDPAWREWPDWTPSKPDPSLKADGKRDGPKPIAYPDAKAVFEEQERERKSDAGGETISADEAKRRFEELLRKRAADGHSPEAS